VVRTDRAFKPFRGAAWNNRRRDSIWVHLTEAWCPHQIGVGLGQLFEVAGFVARVTRQVFVGAELRWVDENRHDNLAGLFAGELNERQMAVV
jgi:hypothetical protein